MGSVGKFFFSKLVLPAIAVQAKESDIEEHAHEQTGPAVHSTNPAVLSPNNHRNLNPGAADAAPAYSQRAVTGRATSAQSAMGDDALLSELMAFRAWQRSRALGPQWRQPQRSPHDGLYTPVPGGSAQMGGATQRIPSHPSATGAPNIIIVNSTKEMHPSNLTATNEPTNMEARVNDDYAVQKITAPGDGRPSPHYPTVVSEEPSDRSLRLDVNDGVAASPQSAIKAPGSPEAASPGHTVVQETKIVSSVVDGKVVHEMVDHSVTYSDDQLYMAATQFYHRVLAEFIGTWALTFFIAGFNIEAGLGHIPQMGVAIGSGLVFVFLIYSLGQVSGAHFNPIVTYAFVLRGMFPLTWLPFYWIVQFVGAILAAAMLLGFYGSTVGDAGANAVPGQYSQEAGFWMETVLSFVLVFTILSMASRSKIVGPHAALAIGAVIAFDVMLAGSYTGASMNPWRSVSISIIFPVTFYSIWVYFAGPFLGATFAVIVVFLLAGKPRNEELTAGIGATIAVAIGNSIARSSEQEGEAKAA